MTAVRPSDCRPGTPGRPSRDSRPDHPSPVRDGWDGCRRVDGTNRRPSGPPEGPSVAPEVVESFRPWSSAREGVAIGASWSPATVRRTVACSAKQGFFTPEDSIRIVPANGCAESLRILAATNTSAEGHREVPSVRGAAMVPRACLRPQLWCRGESSAESSASRSFAFRPADAFMNPWGRGASFFSEPRT